MALPGSRAPRQNMDRVAQVLGLGPAIRLGELGHAPWKILKLYSIWNDISSILRKQNIWFHSLQKKDDMMKIIGCRLDKLCSLTSH